MRARVTGFIAVLMALAAFHPAWSLFAGCAAYLVLVLPAIRR